MARENIFKNFNINKYLTKNPPSNNSFTTKQEIKELNTIPINEKFVEEKDDLVENFTQIVGNDKLIPLLVDDSREALLKIKHHFNRPRPKTLAKELNIPFEYKYMPSMNTPSYPSGHSAQAVLIASVLSDKYPSKREKLHKTARDISFSRNIAHEHYKSDSLFGWQIGKDMYNFIKADV